MYALGIELKLCEIESKKVEQTPYEPVDIFV